MRTMMVVRSMIFSPTLSRSSLLRAPFQRSAFLSWTWLRCTFQVKIASLDRQPVCSYLLYDISNHFLSYLTAALPREILMYIFRWVVSSDLDMRALEQLSLVCRGFYICARSAPLSSQIRVNTTKQLCCASCDIITSFYHLTRDPEIWHLACVRVWGRNCTKVVPFMSWRDMFLRRPRVRFDGK